MKITLDAINDIVQYAPVAASVAALGFAYVRHWKGTLEPKMLKKLNWYLAMFLIVFIATKIIMQYFVYRGDPFAQYFLPPHNPNGWSWFAFSMWRTHIAPFVFSLVAGAFMYFVALHTNKSFKRELFVENDKYIFLLAALMVSWPHYALYLGLVVILTIMQTITVSAAKNDFGSRIILTNALFLSAVAVLLFGSLIAQRVGLWMLSI